MLKKALTVLVSFFAGRKPVKRMAKPLTHKEWKDRAEKLERTVFVRFNTQTGKFGVKLGAVYSDTVPGAPIINAGTIEAGERIVAHLNSECSVSSCFYCTWRWPKGAVPRSLYTFPEPEIGARLITHYLSNKSR